MSRRRTVDTWRRDVLASKAPELTGSVKVLLLYLADHMHTDRRVSVPRAQIAADLGCHEQRVAERFRKAVDAQYLINLVTGHRGVTAVYQGCWPSAESVPITGTQSTGKRTDSRDAIEVRKAVRNQGGKRTAPLDATSRADLSVGEDHPNESSDEEVDIDATSFLSALDTTSSDCPHGIPGGMFPDPWDFENPTNPACPECHAMRPKSEHDGRSFA